MAIDSDYVQSMSTQLAQYAVQAQLTRAQRNEDNYNTQLKAITSLDTALKKFKTTAKGLTSSTSSMLVNSATFSETGYLTSTVSSKAASGSYDFFVKQVASKSQYALSGLQDSDLTAGGSLTLGQGDESFSVSLTDISSMSDLATAINNAADNTGVSAALVRSDGKVNLVLSSKETGAANAIEMSSDNSTLATAIASKKELSKAQDAVIYLGGEPKTDSSGNTTGGIELTSTTNTFDNVIDGVSLTVSKAQASGDAAINLTIAQDKSASQSKLQKFVDGFNALMSSFSELTASGSGGSGRGALASDSSVRSIKSMLNSLVRTSFDGASLIDFGVSANSSGQLTIDATRFEKALAANPEGFDKLFSGKGNLLDSVDKTLSTYTASTGGILTNRKETLNQQLSKISVQYDDIQTQYDSFYNRYLKQYTSLMNTMSAMEQTAGMFA